MITKAAGADVVAAVMLHHVVPALAAEEEEEAIHLQIIAMIMMIVNIMHRKPRAHPMDAVAAATMITHRHRRLSPQCCPMAAAPIVTRITDTSAASGDAAASTRRSTSIDNTHAVAAAARVAAAAAIVAADIDTNGSGTSEAGAAAGIGTTIITMIGTENESEIVSGNVNGIENVNVIGIVSGNESENDAIDRSR